MRYWDLKVKGTSNEGSMSCGGDVMGRENSEENHALFIYFP